MYIFQACHAHKHLQHFVDVIIVDAVGAYFVEYARIRRHHYQNSVWIKQFECVGIAFHRILQELQLIRNICEMTSWIFLCLFEFFFFIQFNYPKCKITTEKNKHTNRYNDYNSFNWKESKIKSYVWFGSLTVIQFDFLILFCFLYIHITIFFKCISF